MTLQIISSDDDTWDDIGIDDNSFMYRTSRGIYTYYRDKDLLRSCRTVLSPSFSDDDDTISTSTSLLSADDQDYFFSDMGDFGSPADNVSSYSTKIQPRNLLSLSSSSSSSKLEYGNHDNNNCTISRNNSLFDLIKDYEGHGTITRLGRTGGSVQVDIGDWSQDLDLPSALKLSTKLGSSSNTKINQLSSSALGGDGDTDNDPFDDLPDDDIFTAESSSIEYSKQKQVRFDQMTATVQGDTDLEQQINAGPINTMKPSLSHHQQKWKEEEDDEGFDDIDIPNDICTRSFKPHQQYQFNATTTATPTTIATSNNNGNRIGYNSSPLLPSIQKQFAQFRETDTDDFLDGLNIKDGIFKATSSKINNKKGGTPTLESKLPRPKRYQQQQNQQLQQLQQQSKPTTIGQHSSPRKKLTPLENRLDRLTAPTYASRQRGANVTPTTSSLSPSALRTSPQNNSPPCSHWDQLKPQTGNLPPSLAVAKSHRHPSHFSTTKYNNSAPTSTPFIRTSDGSTLMTRPRTGRFNYGNGSELDHLDDLAVWKKSSPMKPLLKTMRQSDGSKNGSVGTTSSSRKSDMPSKPWRCNMSMRKMTLIKPDEQKVAKEINGMQYDDKERRWNGNEQATRTFDTPARRRPALIKNNMRHSKTAKSTSALVVGNMTFDQQKMSWNTRNGDEVDVLAHIDDLSEDETQPPLYHHHRTRKAVTGLANHDQGNSHPTNRYNSTTSILHLDALGSSSRLHQTGGDIIGAGLSSCLDSTDMETTTRSCDLTSSSSSSNASVSHQHYLGQNKTLSSSGLHHASGVGGAREFNLPMELQMQMADQEEEHKTYFNAWPLRDQCEMTKAPSGHPVPQNTYILY